MAKTVLTILLTLVTLALAIPTSTRAPATKEAAGEEGAQKDETGPQANQDNSELKEALDMQELMNVCNESFRIEMDNLKSLNETGSFMDETDKTPKCFMRCMLENTGILMDDGRFNTARAAVVFAGERQGKPIEDIADMTALCGADRQEKCLCERSYNFMRCLMTMEIEEYGMSQ